MDVNPKKTPHFGMWCLNLNQFVRCMLYDFPTLRFYLITSVVVVNHKLKNGWSFSPPKNKEVNMADSISLVMAKMCVILLKSTAHLSRVVVR